MNCGSILFSFVALVCVALNSGLDHSVRSILISFFVANMFGAGLSTYDGSLLVASNEERHDEDGSIKGFYSFFHPFKEVRSCYFQSFKFFLTSAADHFQYPDMKFKKNRGSPTFFAHFIDMRRRMRVARGPYPLKIMRDKNFIRGIWGP